VKPPLAYDKENDWEDSGYYLIVKTD